MNQHLEIILPRKTIYDSRSCELINQAVLENGIKAINIFPVYYDQYYRIFNDINIYLNIDMPYSFNNTEGRLSLIQTYAKQNKICGINIGCLVNYNYEDNWGVIEKDILSVVALCVDLNLDCRLFSYKEYADRISLEKLMNLCEIEGLNTILCSSLDQAKQLQECFCMEVGLVGKNLNRDQASDLIHQGFSPILLPPSYLLKTN